MVKVGWDIVEKLPMNGLLKVTNSADETFVGRVIEDSDRPYINLEWIYITPDTNFHHYGVNTLDGLHDNIYTGNLQFFIIDSEQERKELHKMLNHMYGTTDISVGEDAVRIVDGLWTAPSSVSIADVSEPDTSRPEPLRLRSEVRGRFEQIRPAIDPEVEREARARYGVSLVDYYA